MNIITSIAAINLSQNLLDFSKSVTFNQPPVNFFYSFTIPFMLF